ncbi:MAG: DNA repair protein RecN [Deltaproteobacteria bacterium]
MLIELGIRDFAIIESLNISFGQGLNIFTGETGAGKTIIMDAIALILGDRASMEAIRTGTDEAEVQALFQVSGSDAIRDALTTAGIAFGEELIIRRIVSRAGKNRIYINGSLSTLSTLAELGRLLIDVCSQGEHETLLRPEEHIRLLDSFGDYPVVKAGMGEAWKKYIKDKLSLDALLKSSSEIKSRKENLSFRLKEIQDAGLRAGEDTELAKEREVLKNARRLREAFLGGEATLYSDSGSVTERLGAVLRPLKEAALIDNAVAGVVESLKSALYSIEEASASLRMRGESIDEDNARLEHVEERLNEIARLKKKYGGAIEDIIRIGEDALTELQGIEGIDERIEAKSKDVKALRHEAEEIAKELTKKRQMASQAIKGLIEAELKGLGINGAVFDARVDAIKDGDVFALTEDGSDRVIFYISTNPGEALHPLKDIASGGELSRIMLAIKSLTSSGRVPTFVFDEIDAGVGGATAAVLGLKLKKTSLTNQVICITHLPQVAAFADRHFCVHKLSTPQGRTITDVMELTGEKRIEHLSGMLGGMKVTDAVRKGAAELLESARSLALKAARQ